MQFAMHTSEKKFGTNYAHTLHNFFTVYAQCAVQLFRVHLYKDCQWYVSLKEKGQLKDINVKT